MVRQVIRIAIAVWLTAGCASTTSQASAAGSVIHEEEECNRNGGWWRASIGICDN
jgi:hypothetical protein